MFELNSYQEIKENAHQIDENFKLYNTIWETETQ
jgi:hypothetical protein